MRRSFWLLVGSLSVTCGGRSNDADYPESVVEVDELEEENQEPARPPPPKGTLWRDEVDATVDAGLGWFLQRVEVEASLEAGRFKGFRIVKLKTPDFWEGVDLKPGDVILSVNGMPIERDGQAHAAFESLKQSSELRVRYLRAGRERDLVFRITDPPDRPKKPEPSQPTPAPAGKDAG